MVPVHVRRAEPSTRPGLVEQTDGDLLGYSSALGQSFSLGTAVLLEECSSDLGLGGLSAEAL